MSEPVPIRPASTVMLLRDGTASASGALEVFVMRRTTSAAFAGGMYVFPGGKLDDADAQHRTDRPPNVDDAYRLAAIRECFEEAGVLLARDSSGATVGSSHPIFQYRDAVHDGLVGFGALCAEHGLIPSVDELPWVAHWVTPEGEEGGRRFDTRFFVAQAPDDQLLTHDNYETVDSFWVQPNEALRRHQSGELIMMPPTIKNLQFLDRHTSVQDVLLASWAIGTPPRIMPKIRYATDGVRVDGVVLPDEPGYDAV